QPRRSARPSASLERHGAVLSCALVTAREEASLPVDSLHDLKTTSLQGEPADLGDYRGTVVLAVNVASECGLTPQYKALQALHAELAPRGFSVLGFPSNDFGGQEPGSADQIQSFCER